MNQNPESTRSMLCRTCGQHWPVNNRFMECPRCRVATEESTFHYDGNWDELSKKADAWIAWYKYVDSHPKDPRASVERLDAIYELPVYDGPRPTPTKTNFP